MVGQYLVCFGCGRTAQNRIPASHCCPTCMTIREEFDSYEEFEEAAWAAHKQLEHSVSNG